MNSDHEPKEEKVPADLNINKSITWVKLNLNGKNESFTWMSQQMSSWDWTLYADQEILLGWTDPYKSRIKLGLDAYSKTPLSCFTSTFIHNSKSFQP